MTFKYGAADSFYAEPKNHREEQKWSPVVYFDRPRCILCYRCVRMCGEGMDVFALGIQNRGSSSVIAPNIPAQHVARPSRSRRLRAVRHVHRCLPRRRADLRHLPLQDPPLGDEPRRHRLHPLRRRLQDHPWRSLHLRRLPRSFAATTATSPASTATSSATRAATPSTSPTHAERITQPLVRQPDGELKEVSWEEALDHAGKKLRELRDATGGKSIGVIGGNRLTNEEAYLLQKFARTVLGTNNIDHHRTADYVTFAQALAGQKNRTASLRDTQTDPAVLIVGGDPTNQAPGTAWNLRTDVRLNNGPPLRRQHRRDQAPPPGQGLPPPRTLRLRRSRSLPRRRRRVRLRCCH